MLETPPQISLFRAQRIPFGEPWLSGAFPGFTKFVRDRTETRRKLKVARGHFARKADFSAPPRGPSEKIHVHGGSSRPLTGEIGLSEIENVFAEFFICPETIELQKESSRETIFEATVTRFELASRFWPAPGRGRLISRGARLRRAPPPVFSLGRGPRISAF